jgi:hypothetical protein
MNVTVAKEKRYDTDNINSLCSSERRIISYLHNVKGPCRHSPQKNAHVKEHAAVFSLQVMYFPGE